jgi:thioredoxin-like negative regulator of GroEL
VLSRRAAALAAFSAALQAKPEFLHAHLGLARIYTELGDAERVREHLDRGLSAG